MKNSIFVQDIEIKDKKEVYSWGGMTNPSNTQMVYILASLITFLIADYFYPLIACLAHRRCYFKCLRAVKQKDIIHGH